ncbi:MAG: TolC family protein [Candidatus Margulisiibacteriota bacterium]
MKTLVTIAIVMALAQAVCALTWQQAWELAEKNNYQLKSAQFETESVRWNYYKSFTPFLPQLSASLSMGESSSGSFSEPIKSDSYGITATQTLFSGLSNYFSNLSARAGLDRSLASLNQARSDVNFSLRQQFVELAVAEENLKLLKDILTRRRDNTALIDLQFKNGREDKGALLRTRADEAEAEYNLSSAGRSQKLSRLKLTQLLSFEVDRAEGEMKAVPPDRPNFEALWSAAPAYTIAQKAAESADLAYQESISGFLPSISLSGSIRKSGTDWSALSRSNSWSLSVSYPFFPGGSNAADRIRLAALNDQARQDFITARNNLRYAIESAYEQLIDALEAEKVAQLSEAAAKLRAEIARTKYLNGLVGYDEWVIIENDYINSQKASLSRKRAALLAEAAWVNSYGGIIK